MLILAIALAILKSWVAVEIEELNSKIIILDDRIKAIQKGEENVRNRKVSK
jgi:hypothetical protein